MIDLTTLPEFQCHKKVRAFKIVSIVGSTIKTAWNLVDVAGDYHEVSHDWFLKHSPKAGGYFVVYEDGFESFSPAKAFEEGYTEVPA